jgi:hypothetical protein
VVNHGGILITPRLSPFVHHNNYVTLFWGQCLHGSIEPVGFVTVIYDHKIFMKLSAGLSAKYFVILYESHFITYSEYSLNIGDQWTGRKKEKCIRLRRGRGKLKHTKFNS